MRFRVTYIHHNSFVVEMGERAFLFDFPASEHLPTGAREAAIRAISGKQLVIVASHGHADHFDPDTSTLARYGASVVYILSDDIEDMLPESVPTGADVLHVEPDESYDFAGLHIETFLSNDLGVAFLLAVDDFRIWHGGDLACWIWPEAREAEHQFTHQFFANALDRLKGLLQGQPLHVAFQDMDPRLSNLAGGPQFLKRIQPEVFVPMHSFGDLDFVQSLDQRLSPGKAQLFLYDCVGANAEFSVVS